MLKIKLKKQHITWASIFTLVIGMIIGSIYVDPTDAIYFKFSPTLTAPFWQIFFWYFLTAVGYTIYLLVIYFAIYRTRMPAQYAIYFLMSLTVAGGILDYYVLSQEVGVSPDKILLIPILGVLVIFTLYVVDKNIEVVRMRTRPRR